MSDTVAHAAAARRRSSRPALVRPGWAHSKRIAVATGSALAAIGVYALAAQSVDSRALPSLRGIATAFGDLVTGDVLRDEVLPSAQRLLIGLAASIVIGIVLGLVLGVWRGLDPWVRPVFEFLRSAPPPAILPGLIVLLGAGDSMRVSVIVITSVFAVAVNTMDGARRVDPILIDSARMSGKRAPSVMWRVILPASLPEVFVGVRIAIGLALIGTVLSELVAASAGIGVVLLNTMNNFDVATGYAVILLLGIFATVLMTVFKLLQRMFLSWHRGMLKAGQ